ncbi:transcription repressor OFP1 [Lolium perenne]|jgi:uncharacterized protein (TIGR01568 family)|uniref:transcription repressor OFP1 n=1 Tax=Lolium perenne TaxID=4522 RepID=UPI0021F5C4DE|nr:transcription repressor OFP1-like [Lolium perenne]
MLQTIVPYSREKREMSSHSRFRLSDLMPNSWFYKLRDMKRPRPPRQQRSSAATKTSKRSSSSHYYYHGTTTPRPLPLSTHQSYPYLQARQSLPEDLDLSPLHLNSKARNIQLRKDQLAKPRSAALVINEEFQGLKLRPIRTRPVLIDSGSVHHNKTPSSTSPSSPRLRSRRLHVLSSGCRVSTRRTGRRRSAAKRSFAVVVASTDPHRDFWESMVEMIVENDMRGSEALGDLLECYLSLNSREHHGVITEVFRGIRLQVADARVEV